MMNAQIFTEEEREREPECEASMRDPSLVHSTFREAGVLPRRCVLRDNEDGKEAGALAEWDDQRTFSTMGLSQS